MISPWYPVGADLLARDITLEVPLDWKNPDGTKISLYARELIGAENFGRDLPLLLYLQGGPGGKSPRPLDRGGWIGSAVSRFRVILADQRGTGRSTPITVDSFEGLSPEAGASLLACHRADSIVEDFEALRHYLGSEKKWWTLGQSYGGFLTLHYLSRYPNAIEAAAITGGLPSLFPDVDTVYGRTFPRIRQKNTQFRARHPQLVDKIGKVADHLAENEVRLPSGDRLTVRRLQLLGLDFGMGPGFDRVHMIFDEAWADESQRKLSDEFLYTVERATSFATNPLFIALQGSIYGPGPSNWAAQRERARHADFAEDHRPLNFTGETFFPWMFTEITLECSRFLGPGDLSVVH